MSAKTKIAIACQGGGSQTAFTAGALKALYEAQIWQEFELVSISGMSGGAVCAALVWFAVEKGENPLWGRLFALWKDNTAHNWLEETFNHLVVGSMRLANLGLLPTMQLSPSSPFLQSMMELPLSAIASCSETLEPYCKHILILTKSRPGGLARSALSS